MKIDLHIERLVLEGLPPASSAHGAAIGRAVESELTRLLSVDGTPMASSRFEGVVQGGAVRLLPERGPGDLGEQIGAAVYRVLTFPNKGAGGTLATPGTRCSTTDDKL
jgi:hypothetical protein